MSGPEITVDLDQVRIDPAWALRIPVTPLPGENLRLDADTWQSL